MKVKKINWLLMVIHLVVGFGISAVLVLVGGRSLPYEMADRRNRAGKECLG